MNHPFSPLAMFTGLLGLIAVMALSAWTSRINRFFFFARTLPASFAATTEARAITRRYIGMVLIGGGLGVLTLALLYASLGRSIVLATVGGVVVEIIAFHLAFAYAHSAAGKAYAAYAPLRPVSAPANAEHTIAVPLLGSAPQLDLRLLFAPAVLAASLFLAGFATGSSTLSAFTDAVCTGGGAVLLGMACGMLFAGTGQRLLIRYSARHRTPMAQYLVGVMATISWVSALLVGALVIAARLHYPVTKAAARGVMAAIFALVAVHLVYLWSRNNRFTPSPAEQNGDHHWRAGLFYYNRQDPALFVQRRNGPGYTFNFGNRYSWIIAAIVVADPLFVLFNRHHL